MKTGGGKKRAAILLGAATIGLMINETAGAQQAPASSFEVLGSVRGSVEVDDNSRLRQTSPGTDTTFVTALGLEVRSDTPIHALRLSFGADLQYESLAGSGREENGIERPYLRFSYSATGADSELRLNARHREDDIVNSVFLDTDGDLVEDTFLTSNGTIERTSVGATYSFGLEAPFGMDLSVSRDDRNYANVVNPRLFDRRTDRIGAVARFRINPAATARLIARASMFSAEDAVQTERDTTDFGAGINYQVAPDLVVDAEVTQTNIDQTTTGGSTSNDGVSATVGITRDLANGTAGLVASHTQYSRTARTEVVVNRALELPQGEFSFGVGVSSSDTGDTALIGSLNYTNLIPTGTVTASLSRTATVNDSNDEIQRTVLGLGYNHDINANSGLAIEIDVADVEDVGLGSVSNSTRADFRVTYRHQLTQDWDWTLGYVGRYSRNQAGNSATSNAIVTSVGRNFSIRP